MKIYFHLFTLTGLLFAAQFVYAESSDTQPIIGAIIIDDLGYNTISAKRIAAMPFPITCAVLPEAPSSSKAAKILADSGKELMLHLPMQGRGDQAQERNILTVDMDEFEFKQEVRRHLDILPSIAGLNNHQGSVLTEAGYPMHWLMEELSLIDDFYFVDSRTTGSSVASNAAEFYQVPFAVRDIFLDHERSEEFVTHQLDLFIKTAKRHGRAVAIGHPYRETLNVLEMALPELEREGITLVPASQLVRAQMTHVENNNKLARQSSQPNTPAIENTVQ